jgi:hypothetical protein
VKDGLPCSLATRPVFNSPFNDGITECSRNWLPGGGHCLLPDGTNTSDECNDLETQVQHGGFSGSNGCHSGGMHEGEMCKDAKRNVLMNAAAARAGMPGIQLSDTESIYSETLLHDSTTGIY